MVSNLFNRSPSTKDTWIGLDDIQTEGSMVWNDGEPLTGWTFWNGSKWHIFNIYYVYVSRYSFAIFQLISEIRIKIIQRSFILAHDVLKSI